MHKVNATFKTRLLASAAICALIVIAALPGCAPSDGADEATGANAESSEVPRNVRVLTMTLADLEQYLTISGRARALRGTDLSAEESGQVITICADKGSLVREGNELIVLDRRLLDAEMTSACANRDLQAYNTDRMRQLHQANAVSEIEMLEAQTRLRDAEARAQVAEIRFERAAIRAPFGGIVTDRHVELGQLVSPGMPVARIVDPYVLVLESAVTEREVRWVTQGKRAVISFDGVEGMAEGHVYWVGFEADPLSGKFEVEIHIANPDLTLRPGVIGWARILKTIHENVIIIPRDAVVQRASGPVAYVVEGHVARQRDLKLGPDQGLMVMVAEGLKAGDKLIVRGQRDIHDGSSVLVREEATSPDGSSPTDPSVIMQSRTVADRWNKAGSMPGGDR